MNNIDKEYVLGFMFNDTRTKVLLIEKQKPAWQKGLLNGIGGKIESGELPIDALIREFKEECNISTNSDQWTHYCTMSGIDWKVYVYKGFLSDEIISNFTTLTDEEVMYLHTEAVYGYPYISNIPWLIEMALDAKNFNSAITYE